MRSAAGPRRPTRWALTGVIVAGAATMISIGLWCLLDPGGFAQWANWPVHEHFLHDAGVFQIVIGMMVLAALVIRDVIVLTLAGFVLTNGLHALNHFLDRASGGHASDPLLLLTFAALGIAGLVLRLLSRSTSQPAAVRWPAGPGREQRRS